MLGILLKLPTKVLTFKMLQRNQEEKEVWFLQNVSTDSF
jgi:hypothetical protein